MATPGTPDAKPSSSTSGSASEIEDRITSPSFGISSSIFWKPRNLTLFSRPRLAAMLRQSAAYSGDSSSGPAIQPSASGITLTTVRMARMKVLTSLIGTTRPIRHSTRGGAAGRSARSLAMRGRSMPFGMFMVRSARAPSATWRRRLVS